MKLSEIKGEEAFSVLAELIDPVSEIMADKDVENTYRSAPRLALVKLLLQKHQKELITIMATLDRVPVNEYEVSLISLPAKVFELLNDPELAPIFQSQAQTETSSGSVMESTEVKEK